MNFYFHYFNIFIIFGYSTDEINVSGHRIGTAELEGALVEHHACAEAAVVGFPHDIKGYFFNLQNINVTIFNVQICPFIYKIFVKKQMWQKSTNLLLVCNCTSMYAIKIYGNSNVIEFG
jgi:acyl-CoA synthetase (AMP-forming)/AMP-acid ligase II